MTDASPTYLLLGQLRREYLITPAQKVYIDQPGGNLLYAAEGLSLWFEDSEVVGLVARVGEDYPRNWIEEFATSGYNVQGIKILPEEVDLRWFRAFSDLRSATSDDPVAYFARLEMSFPRSLLGYKSKSGKTANLSKVQPISLKQSDLPEIYKYASVAHICPVDYMTHSLMPAALRQMGMTIITLDPGDAYMQSSNWEKVRALMPGLTAFLPSEEDLADLFSGRTTDLWEMADEVASWGVEIVAIKRGVQGQLLYDSESKTRYEIPAYPSKMIDPTGAGDVFCGGFLAGYKKSYNSLEAVLHGNVSASIAVEGSGAFFTSKVLPGLHTARIESLRGMVRKV